MEWTWVEYFADHYEHEGAQVAFWLPKTGERLTVSLFKSDTTEASDEASANLPLVNQLIRLLGQSAAATDDHEKRRALRDEALETIYKALVSVISESENTTRTSTTGAEPDQTPSLHTVLYPKISHNRLESTTQQTARVLIPIQAREAYDGSFDDPKALPDNNVEFQTDSSVPRYSTHQVRVVKEIVDSRGAVCLVTVDGQSQQLYFKARREELTASRIEREIDLLQNILRGAPFLAGGQSFSNCQVPGLKGYIEHPENGIILGYLQKWVPSKHSLQDLNSTELGDLVITRDMREKWAGQMKRTIRTLHAIGVAWGEAEPSNVIIDLDGDAWIIAFGCGRNNEWDNQTFREFVRCDKKGLAMILMLLDVNTGCLLVPETNRLATNCLRQ